MKEMGEVVLRADRANGIWCSTVCARSAGLVDDDIVFRAIPSRSSWGRVAAVALGRLFCDACGCMLARRKRA